MRVYAVTEFSFGEDATRVPHTRVFADKTAAQTYYESIQLHGFKVISGKFITDGLESETEQLMYVQHPRGKLIQAFDLSE